MAVEDFHCPRCAATYKLIKVEAPTVENHRPLPCIVCREPLPATQGKSLLKYFLFKRPKKK